MATQAVLDTTRATTEVEEFQARIDELIEKYELDPGLPELTELKGRAATIVRTDLRTGLNHRGVQLMRLDPYRYVKWCDGSLVVMQESETSALRPCNLIRYHLRSLNLDEVIKQIVVDQAGIYIYSGGGRELARCPTGANYPGSHLELAAQSVNNFTWLRITPQELWEKRRAIFSFTGNGWVVHTPLRTAA